MSEAPKKIWIYGKQWQETPDFYPRTFESDKPMVSKESYIRADLVDELVKALKWIDVVNSMEYEYRKVARAALAKLEECHE